MGSPERADALDEAVNALTVYLSKGNSKDTLSIFLRAEALEELAYYSQSKELAEKAMSSSQKVWQLACADHASLGQ